MCALGKFFWYLHISIVTVKLREQKCLSFLGSMKELYTSSIPVVSIVCSLALATFSGA